MRNKFLDRVCGSIAALALLLPMFGVPVKAQETGVIVEAEDIIVEGTCEQQNTLLMDTYNDKKFYNTTGVMLPSKENWYSDENAQKYGYQYDSAKLTQSFKNYIAQQTQLKLSFDTLKEQSKIDYGQVYDVYIKASTLGTDGLDSLWSYVINSNDNSCTFLSGFYGTIIGSGYCWPAAAGIPGAVSSTMDGNGNGYRRAATEAVWTQIGTVTAEEGISVGLAGRESPFVDKICIIPSGGGTAEDLEKTLINTHEASFEYGGNKLYGVIFEYGQTALADTFRIGSKVYELKDYTAVSPYDGYAAAHPNFETYFKYGLPADNPKLRWEKYTLSDSDITVNAAEGTTVTLPSIFSDGMMLQRGQNVSVWGSCTDDGKEISVSIAGQTKTAVSNGGKWSVTLDGMQAAENLTMKIEGSDFDTIEINDIAVGEIWLCAGQSNMDFRLNNMEGYESNYKDTMAENDIRVFSYSQMGAFTEQSDVTSGKWRKAAASNAGYFSAIGYVAAKKLSETLNVPVGIIMSNRGDTNINVWVNKGVLQSRDEYSSILEKYNTEYAAYKEDPSNYTGNPLKQVPTSFYNNMIYPLRSYGVKGVLWYQGCNDSGDNMEVYKNLFRDLTALWRSDFNNENLPFITFQLAPYSGGDLRMMRNTQLELAREMDNVYLISTAADGYSYTAEDEQTLEIHPYRKEQPALRAAHTALNNIYGNTEMGEEYSAPIPASFYRTADGAMLRFTHTGTGLRQDNTTFGKLRGFEVSGDGVNYYDADARIMSDGKTVKLICGSTNEINYIRYAYKKAVIEYTDGTYSGEYDSSKSVLRTTLGGNLTNNTGYPTPMFALDNSYAELSVVYYDENGSVISKCSPKHKTVTAQIKTTDKFMQNNAEAWAAMYTDGKLVSVKKALLRADNTEKLVLSNDAGGNSSEVKTYIWDKDSMQPLCKPYVLNAAETIITKQGFDNAIDEIYSGNAAEKASQIVGENSVFTELNINEPTADYDYENGAYKYIQTASGLGREDGDMFLHMHTQKTSAARGDNNSIILRNNNVYSMSEGEKFVLSFDFYDASPKTDRISASYTANDSAAPTTMFQIKFGQLYYFDGTYDHAVSYKANEWNTLSYECEYGSYNVTIKLNGEEIIKTQPITFGKTPLEQLSKLKLTLNSSQSQANDFYIDNLNMEIYY